MKRRYFLGSCVAAAAAPLELQAVGSNLPSPLAPPLILELDSKYRNCIDSDQSCSLSDAGQKLEVVWRDLPTGHFWSGKSIQQHSRYAASPAARTGKVLVNAKEAVAMDMSLDGISGVEIGVNRGYLFVNRRKMAKPFLINDGPLAFKRQGLWAHLYVGQGPESPLNDWMLPYLLACNAFRVLPGEQGCAFSPGNLADAILMDLVNFKLVNLYSNEGGEGFDELFHPSSKIAAVYASTNDWQRYLSAASDSEYLRRNTYAVSIDRLFPGIVTVAPVVDSLRFGAALEANASIFRDGEAKEYVLQIVRKIQDAHRLDYESCFVPGMDTSTCIDSVAKGCTDDILRFAGGHAVTYFFTALSQALLVERPVDAVKYAATAANYYFS